MYSPIYSSSPVMEEQNIVHCLDISSTENKVKLSKAIMDENNFGEGDIVFFLREYNKLKMRIHRNTRNDIRC